MKTINVVAAVIRNEDKIFATARGYGEFKGYWEFPGGKIESGETPEQALVREINEELDTEIAVGEVIGTIEYDYPTFHLSMQCFWCTVISGNLVLKEAQDARWLTKDTLDSVEWLPADIVIIDKIRVSLQSGVDMTMTETTYNKLVRDNIPEIIAADGTSSCEIRQLSDEEYLPALNKKLQEEVTEYLESETIEELADIEEVIRAILATKGSSYDELEMIRKEKKDERGAFEKRLFLVSTTKSS